MTAPSLSGVAAESERKAAHVAAVAAEPDDAAKAAATQTAMQEHYARAITCWCECSGAAAVANQFMMREDLVDSGVLDTWQTQLEAKGYEVERTGQAFKIKLSP